MINIEIYDCTLREGEQAAGASFNLQKRVELFKLLDNLGIEYIEVGWPVASKEIMDSFEMCNKVRKNAKIVAFGSTSRIRNAEKDKNLRSLIESGSDYACIFGKTNLAHVEKQLGITPEENLERIRESVGFLAGKMKGVFYDAEHFFDSFKENEEYALETLVNAYHAGAERLVLCDTNGGTLPNEAEKIVKTVKKSLSKVGAYGRLGVHFHDDCGLALANTLVSLPNVIQVQGTINGIGERTGGLNLGTFLPIYQEKLGGNLEIKLKNLKHVNEESFHLAGLDIPESRPFVGNTAFAHKGGTHIDATLKGASYEHINPESVGNRRVFVMNTLGGMSNVVAIASSFGYALDKKDPRVKKKAEELFRELKDYETRGYRMGMLPAEQFLLVEKYFGNLETFIEVEQFKVNTEKKNGKEKSNFYMSAKIDGRKVRTDESVNGGPIDAAYKTMRKSLSRFYPMADNLALVDFHVGIANRRSEESHVRTEITFKDGEEFSTVGVDKNIIASGVEAIVKGFNYYLNRIYRVKYKRHRGEI